MTNTRTWILGLAVASLTALSGCNLYFGDDFDDDDYTYCDETGCWWCDDFGCYPTDGGGGVDVGGECNASEDCPEGCFCNDGGVCEEFPVGGETCETNDECPMGTYCDPNLGVCVGTWTCSSDEQCDPGFECDDRGSCVPGSCETDDQCLEGCVCVDGTCEETGVCASDADCGEGQQCDPERNTCTNCPDGSCTPDDPGVCYAEPACDEAPPSCPDDTLPGVLDGCYSGFCIPVVLCPDEPPPPPIECRLIETQDECEAEAECRPVVGGTDCTYPDTGAPCEAGVPGCVCESVGFIFCTDRD